MNLFLSLIPNLEDKLNYVIFDFVHYSLDPNPLIIFAINLTFSIVLIYISYLVGKKLTKLILSDKLKKYNFLLSIALGYILISTGFAMLGFFSQLKPEVIMVYLASLIIVAAYPFQNLKLELKNFIKYLYTSLLYLRRNNLVFVSVILFVLISAINLINPEIREDQYHVDFPVIYLREETIMIPPKEDLHVSGSSMLAEMYYLPGILLMSKDSARYVHFLFYILVLIALLEFSKLKNYKFAVYTPLFFITAPVVIHETSSMYVDFQWIFLFLLSILLVIQTSKTNLRTFFILGILLGGMVATKLWTIVLVPILILFTIYIYRKKTSRFNFKIITSIFFGILMVSALWFIRAYILTGNVFFPAFHTFNTLENFRYSFNIQNYFAFNKNLINPYLNLNVYSPLFFLGILLLLYKIRSNFNVIKKQVIFKLLLLLFLLYLFINYPYGRYLLGIYVLFIFLSSLSIHTILNKVPNFKLILYFLIFLTFGYYFISSILVLPYTFGISDKNKYLSRVLIKDNSSYYDFGNVFNKHIGKEDLVAMYNFHGYYYADFNFVDVNSILDIDNKSMDKLKKERITKLIIRGGDINWFCAKIKLADCKENNYSLVSSYLHYPYYYLYNIK